MTVIFGPGAALSRHDELWYLDQTKRYAEAAVGAGAGRNLGQRGTPVIPTTRRLFYVDWPIWTGIARPLLQWCSSGSMPRPPIDVQHWRSATLAATARTREIQRLEKLLEDAGLKLSSVATQITVVSSRAMLSALIAGEHAQPCSPIWPRDACATRSVP